MCGILVAVDHGRCTKELEVELSKRGPDCSAKVQICHRNRRLEMHGFVLGMRGQLTSQPLHTLLNSSDFTCLLFNGEIYSGLSVSDSANDSKELFDCLLGAKTEEEMLEIFSKIEGEWALCLLFKGNLYYGRDYLGRRSLLIQHRHGGFLVSSVSDQTTGWNEVPATGIFKYDFQNEILLEWNKFPGLTCPSLKTKETNVERYPIIESDLSSTASHLFDGIKLDFRYEPCIVFKQLLKEAVSRRIMNIPSSRDSRSRLAILFSGGVDCMVLAALAHQCFPQNEPIDLLNVAFENPRTSSKLPATEIYNVPDRLTARQGLVELMKIYQREWVLVEIDVDYNEYREKKPYVQQLIYPLDSVMDLSIAIAFWFASRGIGKVDGKDYQSTARVLLSGLGADEQLGGYSRHRNAYFNGGWSRLAEEMQLDVARISTRNLGRDDRVISSHGKEVRFPFLDRTIINFLLEMPTWYKTDPRLEREVGDKLLIRMMAYELGLVLTCREAKRAVQFGAKTAKMEHESRASKGHDKLLR